jgi:hypothetical protein
LFRHHNSGPVHYRYAEPHSQRLVGKLANEHEREKHVDSEQNNLLRNIGSPQDHLRYGSQNCENAKDVASNAQAAIRVHDHHAERKFDQQNLEQQLGNNKTKPQID